MVSEVALKLKFEHSKGSTLYYSSLYSVTAELYVKISVISGD
jgi:hypothetical protein